MIESKMCIQLLHQHGHYKLKAGWVFSNEKWCDVMFNTGKRLTTERILYDPNVFKAINEEFCYEIKIRKCKKKKYIKRGVNFILCHISSYSIYSL